MALYSKSSQQSVNSRSPHKKIAGVVLCGISILMLICLTFSFPSFISNFFYGVFGLLSYAIFSFLLIIGISVIANKKLIKNIKYFIFVLCAVICIATILHILLSKNALSTSFSDYVSYCYNHKNTVGGVLIGMLSYVFFAPFKIVGACIIISIMLVVFIGLSVDCFLKNENTIKSKAKKIRDKIVLKEVENISKRQKAKPEDSGNSTKKPESKLRNILNLNSHSQEKVTDSNNVKIETTESVLENTYYKPKSSEERRKYILTPPSMDEIYNFSRKTSSSPLKNTITNTTLPARPSRNPFVTEESMQKNREFLKSTYPNYKEKKIEPETEYGYIEETDYDPNLSQSTNESTLNSTYSNYSNSFDSQIEENTSPEEDFVNFKLEELKNNINLNSEPIVPPSNSRASLLNSAINSEPTFQSFSSDVNKTDNSYQTEEDNEDYGSIHQVPETPVEPTPMNSNRFSNYSNSSQASSSLYSSNRFSQNNETDINSSSSQYNSTNSYTSQSQTKPKRKKAYVKPPIDLLNTISSSISNDDEDCQTNVAILEQTLDDFRIPAKVRQVTKGPAVTRYEIQMPAGISVKKVQQHAEDIAMALSANGKIRIEAPIPGKNAVGIEVPNREVATIGLRDVIDSENFMKATSPLTFALGKDITGEAKICDLRKLTHMLVAGTTGSGKSVCMNTLIVSMMYKSSPEDLRFILVDPKRVEFAVFNGMPHLMLPEVISEPEKALNALSWCIKEMERRYGIIEEARVKNLKEYNETPEVLSGEKPKLPLIVVIVDELCDLMMFNKREVEEKILKLAQKSRAAGIHLVLATQRPSVDVITGTIKGNLPSRIAFAVTSFPDSKTILDCGGAERLLGRGDMLYAPQELPEPVRLQGAFISNSEVEAVVDFIKQNNDADFDEETSNSIVSKQGSKMGGGAHDTSEDFDDFFVDALRLVIENGSASGSFIQRRLGIGYNRAGRIMDQMEREKFIAPSDGSNKPRAVFITMEEFERRFNN